MAIPLLAIITISPDARRRLESAGFELHLASELGGRAAAIARVPDARAVVTSGSQGLTGPEIDQLPNLELICAIGAGYEGIDLDVADQRGIVVTNGAGTNSTAVADHAMTLLLAVAGTIVPANAAVRRGDWSNFPSRQRDGAGSGQGTDFPFRRVGVSGKKLGILGLGVIGKLIAHRAADGFDMEVAYHSRHPVEVAPYRYMDSLNGLAEWSDFLVLAAPGGRETRHMVNASVLDHLGPGGYLVNIGRGTVVDTDALIDALGERRIAGAALDVVEGEPNIPPRLLTIENLLLTPHMAGGTPESSAAMAELVAGNLTAFFAGQPVRNRIN